MEASLKRGGAPDRILQKFGQYRPLPRRWRGGKTMEMYLAPDFLANRASSVSPVLIGTTALSAVSGFATAHAARIYRSGRKVNRLHSSYAVRAVSDRHSVSVRAGQ
jgi:hypothetical protein